MKEKGTLKKGYFIGQKQRIIRFYRTGSRSNPSIQAQSSNQTEQPNRAVQAEYINQQPPLASLKVSIEWLNLAYLRYGHTPPGYGDHRLCPSVDNQYIFLGIIQWEYNPWEL
uniref:Uncharacterized protein n=2 Tax=Picea TaxID=3328 RepID=A0A101LTZ0_PICGL|nr:hypothetical protein ABT39_MTgene3469 [Picea glauca]QHR89687.1 hypothetical protein Q903MT_gene3709 [Picea sitchensis]